MTQKFAFTQQQRLVAKEFDPVFKEGRRFKTDLFIFVYLHVSEGPNKLGLVTSKKKVRTAVQRNIVRRITRESFRLHQTDLVHYHVVAIANPAANNAVRQDLHQCLNQFWQYLIQRSKRDASG